MAIETYGDTINYMHGLNPSTASVVVSVPMQQDSDGGSFNPDNLPQTLGYTDGNLTSITVTNGTDTWVQTLSYTGSDLTSISAWVKQ